MVIKAEGTGVLTTSKHIMIFWSQWRFTKIVPVDPTTNGGLTTTASGASSFRAFCTTIEKPETRQTNLFTTHIIPDDEKIQWSHHSQQKPAPTKYSKPTMTRRLPRHRPQLLTLAQLLMSSLRTRNQSHWTLKMSCCGGIITLGTCPLTALNNWPPRGSSRNACLPVTRPFVPLANMAR